MSAPRYALDDRTAAGILAELRAAATAGRVPGDGGGVPGAGPTWADVLFRDGELAAAEPSAALLHAFVELYPGVLRHLDTLPDRALVDWLERRLGIPRLPVVPDRVVAVPKPDPKKLPVVVPAGTALRGGRDVAGNERRYLTTDTLSVLGSTLVDVRSYRVTATPSGESMASWTDPKVPFEPFPTGATVPHELELVTDVIGFSGGSMTIHVVFEGGPRALPAGMEWRFSTPTGLAPATTVTKKGKGVELQLDGACGPLVVDGVPRTFLQVSLPKAVSGKAFTLSFDHATVAVTKRRTVAPEAGFFNDGVLDITKEFQPFGPVPKRGDSFYIKSDEAFAKPLASLTVNLELLGGGVSQMKEVAWGGGVPSWITTEVQSIAKADTEANKIKKTTGQTTEDKFRAFMKRFDTDAGDARVEWQRFDGSEWVEFAHTDDVLTGISASDFKPIDQRHSHPATVAGVRGRMVRAFLDRGDFGWNDYQKRIARFAAEAAKTDGAPAASDLLPPEIPVVSKVSLEYTTGPAKVEVLRARNGWSSRRIVTRDRMFRLPLDRDGETHEAGTIAIGLAGLPSTALGSTVSLYIDIAPAAACTTSDAIPRVIWEYWSETVHWLPLDDVDGTLGLRQAGLLRFVGPADWVDGCPDVSSPVGRWIRARTNLPDRLGTIRAIVPDAVTAEYRSQLPDPAADASPEIPLAARELKGLTVPIDGIKKFTNPLPGTIGRGPEPDATYVGRAADWTRHRNRAIQAWDYEAMVTTDFPEVATVRCLPHTGTDGEIRPGLVGLAVVPWSDEPQPYPSVTLAERILDALEGRLPVHARPIILCPVYVAVSVEATAVLRPGYSASESKRTLGAAIDAYLHPGANAPFGRELFASTMVRFLESRPEIDHVTAFALGADPCPPGADADGCRVERVAVDACRGLVASAGRHALTLAEQL